MAGGRAGFAWRPPWLNGYSGASARQDLVAGLVVVMMLVPQSLAYALLAGLPAEAGLYASILPIVAYAAFGSSRTLAVGPVAVVSLMTASAIAPLAATGSPEAVGLALVLALLSGGLLILCGVLRLGVIAHLLSHPVVNGFMAGSAVLIILGQLFPLFGVQGHGHSGLSLAIALPSALAGAHPATALMGAVAVLALALARRYLGPLLRRLGLRPGAAEMGARLAPMCVVLVAIALTALMNLDQAAGVAVVGSLPSSLPSLGLPTLELGTLQALLLPAGAIALVGFIESVSVAQSLAMREREQIDPNRELLGLGAANVMASLAGGLPVTGGLSRSVVNYAAGARSPLAGVVSALALVVILLNVSELFERLPKCVLAASIIVPMTSLLNPADLRRMWSYSPPDGLAYLATALGVLTLGVEAGIALGVALSLLTVVWQASQPHIAVIGRVPGTEQYRNVKRAEVTTWPHILALRVDENLFFGNISTLEHAVQEALAAQPTAGHVILVLSSVSHIDATALERLLEMNHGLAARQIKLHLAEVKGPVLDQLQRTSLPAELGGRVFRFTHEAFSALLD